MHLTLTTTIMAVITTCIFLSILTLCLMHNKLLVRFGYKLLALFVVFSFLRFLLPIEFPFARNIAFTPKISYILAFLRHRLFSIGEQSVSIWLIFKYIWIIGASVGIIYYLVTYLRVTYHITLYGKNLTDLAPYKELMDRICSETKHVNNFQIIELPDLVMPMLFGMFSPKILLPEGFQIDDPQSYYVLRHEMTHHFHHDLILKCLIRLITIIYWWNPLCSLLNKQVAVILEMHVDDSLTRSDPKRTVEYINCLIDYKTSTIEKTPLLDNFTINLIPKGNSDFKKRSYLMLNNQKKSDLPLSILMSCIVLAIYFCSYLFILEGFNSPQENNIQAPEYLDDLQDIHIISDTASYFIDNGDGTYDLYCDGMYLETTDTLDGYNPIPPIYTPENNPYKDSTR